MPALKITPTDWIRSRQQLLGRLSNADPQINAASTTQRLTTAGIVAAAAALEIQTPRIPAKPEREDHLPQVIPESNSDRSLSDYLD